MTEPNAPASRNLEPFALAEWTPSEAFRTIHDAHPGLSWPAFMGTTLEDICRRFEIEPEYAPSYISIDIEGTEAYVISFYTKQYATGYGSRPFSAVWQLLPDGTARRLY